MIEMEIICYCKQGEPTCVYPKCRCNTPRLNEEPKQETLEEVANRVSQLGEYDRSMESTRKNYFIGGAKWQQERSYSEEDLISFAHFYFKEEFNSTMQTCKSTDEIFKEWFKQFKKT